MRLHTDEGLVGTAIAHASAHAAARLVAALLLERDARAVSDHWRRLSRANAEADDTLATAVAAIDIALWDLKAKHNEEPLWRTLGALRPRVNAHARAPADVDSLKEWCRDAAAASIKGVVIDATGDHERDAERLTTIHEALSKPELECSLMLDAGERWTPKDAIRAVCELERAADLTWIEAPTLRHDFLGHKRIVDSIKGAVCAGGQLTSAAQFLPHLHHRSINIVQLDVARTGITAALRIADAAYGFELPVAFARSPGNWYAHVAAVLPYTQSIEVDLIADAAIDSDVRIDAGRAVAGDRAGHGIVLSNRHS